MESASVNDKGVKLGINGFGRIGKLTLWHHIGRKYFKEIVINIGREVGTSLEDIAHYVERDSTYGLLRQYLYGHRAKPVIRDLDEKKRIHENRWDICYFFKVLSKSSQNRMGRQRGKTGGRYNGPVSRPDTGCRSSQRVCQGTP